MSNKKDTSTNNIDLDKNSLTPEEIDKLEGILKKIDALDADQVDFLKLSIQKNSNNDLIIKVLIRNGSKENLDIKQLSMQILNKNKEIVGQGTFVLDGLIIKAYCAKASQFRIPSKSVFIKNSNFSECSIRVIPPLLN